MGGAVAGADRSDLPDWRVVAVRGVLALAFGLVVLFWPAASLETTLFAFAAFALVYGVVALVSAFRRPAGSDRLAVVEGVAGIAVAVAAFAWPGPTATVATAIVALWAVVVGGIQALEAIRRRDAIPDEWLRAVAGGATVLFGVLLITRPYLGGPALTVMVGVYAVALGGLVVAFAAEARRRAGTALGNP